MSRYWSKEADKCDEFVISAYEDYSVDTVAEVLLPTGLLIDKSTQYTGTFEKYVFLNCNIDEIYTRQEIDFISAVGEITVFAEYYKKTKRGVIPCRVVVARNVQWDSVDFSVAFIKLINKASDGFNICITFSDEGIIFICSAYDDFSSNNFYISDIIKTYRQMEKMYDVLMYSADYSGFIDYYSYIRDNIQFKKEAVNYLSKKCTHRLAYEYIEMLWKFEKDTRINFSAEIERCFLGLEERCKKTYEERVAESEKNLFKIESFHINTLEMLFEAEEREKLAIETEQRNETLMIQDTEEEVNKYEDNDMKIKALLDDPELMIKLLKKKRGI